MTAEQDHSQREQQLRQLAHDIRTPLGIITHGIEALNAVREDADSFKEVYETIQEDGVESLKTLISRLIEVACNEKNENPNQG